MPALSNLNVRERQLVNQMEARGFHFIPYEDEITFICAGHAEGNILDYKDCIIFNSWLDVEDCVKSHPELKVPFGIEKFDDNAIIYKNSFDFANEFGEDDLYLDSEAINTECLKDLERYIREHFDGLKFNKEGRTALGYANPVSIYSNERMEFVLSEVVLMNKEKYSPEIQEWAQKNVPFSNLDEKFLTDEIDFQKKSVLKEINEINPYIIEGYLGEAIPIMENHIVEHPFIPEGIQLKEPFRYYLENAESVQDINDKFSKMEDFLDTSLLKAEIKPEGLIYRDGFGKEHYTYGYVESDVDLDGYENKSYKKLGFVATSFPKFSPDMDLNMGLKWLSPYNVTKTVSDLLVNCMNDLTQKADFKDRLNEERGEAFDELTDLMDEYWELDIETNYDEKSGGGVFSPYSMDEPEPDIDVLMAMERQIEILDEACPLEKQIDRIDKIFENMMNSEKIIDEFDINYIQIGEINIYGNRTREGLFDIEESPLNIVVSYKNYVANFSEQEIEDIINNYMPKINGMEVNVRCINPDETGLMAEFMKADKEDLDRKEQECLYVKGTPVSYYSKDEKRPSFSKTMKDAKSSVKGQSKETPKIKLYRDKSEKSL